MSELLTYIARSLVTHPDGVSIKELPGSDSIILELRVHADDMGKVIGKQGRIARAIRTVIKAASLRSPLPVFVEIV